MREMLHHFLLPRVSNNYRARVLHNKIILILTLFFFSSGFIFSFFRTNFPSVLGTFADISNDQLLILTNQKRQENGIGPLSLNGTLSQAASNKASDMFAKDYWAHNAPDGTTPWVFIKSAGYNYIYAGENLARGFTNANDAINAWMNSPEHRQNMLSSNYKDVGFAVSTGRLSGEDTVLIVEMFGSTNFAPAPVAQTQQVTPTPVVVAQGPITTNVTPTLIPTPTLTPTPTLIPTIALSETLGANKEVNISQTQPQILVKPLVNSQTVSLATARVVISFFILVLVLDMFMIERRKIVRFVGHNLDHIFFFGMLLLIVLIIARGSII